MPEESVKSLKITGSAADDYNKMKGGTRRRKKQQMGQAGGDLPPGQSLASAQNYNAARRLANSAKIFKGGATQTLPGSNPPNPVNLSAMPAVSANLQTGAMPPTAEVALPKPPASLPVPPSTIPTTQPSNTSAPAPTTQQKGGKITLAPAKKKIKSAVILAPPAAKKRKGLQQTRKIRVQLSGLKKRLTKAKTIHKDSREKSIPEIRKLLEEAKLVKPAKDGKQVPESVLRDIYKDYLLLRNRAL